MTKQFFRTFRGKIRPDNGYSKDNHRQHQEDLQSVIDKKTYSITQSGISSYLKYAIGHILGKIKQHEFSPLYITNL